MSPDVWELRPDYRAELIVARGLQPVPSVELDELVARAEQRALTTLADTPVAEIGHIGSWREAFRAFGAKPSDYRNSAEALMRRASAGLPRINPLTDAYNAISVLHATPIGGENLQAYAGPARLVRASGDETFDTVDAGQPVVEHPKPGEVVWRDDQGVTCRRWNWRQCQRTALGDDTTDALFIIDTLAPLEDSERDAVAEELIDWLQRFGAAAINRRTVTADPSR